MRRFIGWKNILKFVHCFKAGRMLFFMQLYMNNSYAEIIRIAVFSLFAVPALVADIRFRRIPDLASIGGLVLLFSIDFLLDRSGIPSRLFSAFIASGLFLAVRLRTNGLGLGDVKLAAFIGYGLGPLGSLIAFPVSALSGIAYALFGIVVRGKSTKERIPYAPFLVAGAYLGMVALLGGWDSILLK